MGKRSGRKYQEPHKKVKDKILRLDPICSYCRVKPSVNVDHIIPRGKGGDNRQENLAGSCYECNETKSGYFLYETDLFLHPSDRLIDICEARGVDPFAYNDDPRLENGPVEPVYVSASEVANYYGTSLGERLSALGMNGLSVA